MSYVPMKGTKTCRKCEEEKDVFEFRTFKVYGSPDREYRRSWCKNCEKEYSRQWRRRPENKDYHAEWSRNYRAMKP